MIASKTQLKSTIDQLHTLIARRESALKSTIKTFNSWKEIANIIKNLLSSMTRVKSMLLNDEKELKELKTKYQTFFTQTNNKHSITLFEIQAIISNTTPNPTNVLIDTIQTNLKKLKQILENRTADINELKIKYNPVKKPYCEINRFMECNGIAKYELLSKPIRGTSECRRYARDCVVSFNNMVDKKKDNVRRVTTERNSPAKRKLQFTKLDIGMSNPKEEVIDRLKCQLKQPYTRNGEIRKAKAFSLTGFDVTSKPLLEALNILAEESKTCTVCGESSTILLKCCGNICVYCARKRFVENNPFVLVNAFEAEKKQDTICVCPVHKMVVGIELLRKIFSDKELEKLSIEALKREIKERKVNRMKNPILCNNCRGIMNDDIKTTKTFNNHKVCNNCFLYFLD